VSLGARLSEGSRVAAVGSGFAVVLAGNVQGALDALRAPLDRGFDYWHASRVITKGDTINEFPFFTFFHADLHPHLLAFPFYLAAFVFIHRLFEQEPFRLREPRTPPVRAILPFLFTAIVAGTAVAANTWNLPSIAIGLIGAMALRARPPRPMNLARCALAGAATRGIRPPAGRPSPRGRGRRGAPGLDGDRTPGAPPAPLSRRPRFRAGGCGAARARLGRGE
jgi:hypothetical protein